MQQERQSNFELCRIFSIILVMIIHTTFTTFGWKSTSLWVNSLAALSIVGANVFVLITGYFSASPRKTSLVNLAFICLFWGVLTSVINILLGQKIGLSSFFFITRSNWFVVCYIALIFFSPILNSYCLTVNKTTLGGAILSLLIIQTWFDWLPPYPDFGLGSQNGYSLISFAILYLLARYVRLYGLPIWFKHNSIVIYIICSIFLLGGSFICTKYGRPLVWWFAYINPLIILSSVAVLISFEKLKVHSKLINHLAKSVLACLLGHTMLIVFYKKLFAIVFERYDGIEMALIWFLLVLIVFGILVAIDQLRILIYQPIEKILKSKIRQNLFYGSAEIH